MAVAAFVLSIMSMVATFIALLMDRRRNADSVRPVLVVSYTEQGWGLKNAGNGLALEVLLVKVTLPSGDPATSDGIQVQLPPVPKGDTVLLAFVGQELGELEATYSDMAGRRYRTNYEGGLSSVEPGDGVSPEVRQKRNREAKPLWAVRPARAGSDQAPKQEANRATDEAKATARSAASP